MGQHGDLELLKMFNLDIQDGGHVGYLGIFLRNSPSEPYVGFFINLVGLSSGQHAYGDLELLKSFYSDILDGCHSYYGGIIQAMSLLLK